MASFQESEQELSRSQPGDDGLSIAPTNPISTFAYDISQETIRRQSQPTVKANGSERLDSLEVGHLDIARAVALGSGFLETDF